MYVFHDARNIYMKLYYYVNVSMYETLVQYYENKCKCNKYI